MSLKIQDLERGSRELSTPMKEFEFSPLPNEFEPEKMPESNNLPP
jgi:hypothetical protein